MLDVRSLIHTAIDKPTLCCVHSARRNDQDDARETKKETPRFSACAWTDKQVGDLVQALPSFTNLKKLFLVENEIENAGAKHLADFLMAHFMLRHLWIDNSGKFFLVVCDHQAVMLRDVRHVQTDP